MQTMRRGAKSCPTVVLVLEVNSILLPIHLQKHWISSIAAVRTQAPAEAWAVRKSGGGTGVGRTGGRLQTRVVTP